MINKNTYDEIDICVAKMTRVFFQKRKYGKFKDRLCFKINVKCLLFHIQKD